MKLIAVLVLGSLSAFALAANDEEQIRRVIAAMETGWEKADGTPFREHFLDFDRARYFESGRQNVGLADLIEHHVEPEGEALALELEFTNPQIRVDGDFAWVLFGTEINATVHETGQRIHNKGFETVILRKIDGQWKVLHTHSSSRAVKTD